MTPDEILAQCASSEHHPQNPPLYCGACVAKALEAQRETCWVCSQENASISHILSCARGFRERVLNERDRLREEVKVLEEKLRKGVA